MYDLIIIGAGSGGLNIASFMQSVGLRVLLIDRSDAHIGGDCLNTGCVPSKALLYTARLAAAAAEARALGLRVSGTVDMGKVRAHIRAAQEAIRAHENAAHLRNKGIEVVLGDAAFEGEDAVRVGEKVFRAPRIVIATGARPRTLALPGMAAAEKAGRVHTHETIFSLATLPREMAIIGGGPIGIELGQAFLRLGSKVTVVTCNDRILPREDADLAGVLEARLREEGMRFLFNALPVRIGGDDTLVVRGEGKGELTLTFDTLLISIGRVPNIEGLRLEKAGIAQDNGKIRVDAHLRTTNPRVFVCGDAAGSYQFTHTAEAHAALLIRNFLTPLFKKKLSPVPPPRVTYTTPEIAAFGYGEHALQARGIPYRTLTHSFDEEDRAITDDARWACAKVFLHPKKGTLLGGAMVAPGAGELVQELILLMEQKLPLRTLFEKTYPYPTAARANRALAAVLQKERLTPLARSLFRGIYRALNR